MSYLTPKNKFVDRMKNIHLIGIGGSGMSGIAEVLNNLGFHVSGSDVNKSEVTQRLESIGIIVKFGHHIENLKDVNVVVVSSAIQEDNIEFTAAKDQKIEILSRAEMLAELMRFKIGIAVAGTHGKTTTTSLIASVLEAGDLDPTFVIGGLLNSAGTNAALGQSEYLVAEADESDGSFQLLQPVMAVITNIDADHMQTFGGKFSNLKKAFENFLQHLPFYGVAALCVDDPEVKELADRWLRPTLTYGLTEFAHIRAINIQTDQQHMKFDVLESSKLIAKDVSINLPGNHNVQNALAAIAIGLELEIDIQQIIQGLSQFQGVGRRFNLSEKLKFSKGTFHFVDDYAHHPTEITAAINACRGGWDNRLVVIFQPHRYTRTRDLFDEFTECLNQTDLLIVSDVYPAGESPISGAYATDLCRTIRNRGKIDPVYVADINDIEAELDRVLIDNDLVLSIGAGTIGRVNKNIINNGGLLSK